MNFNLHFHITPRGLIVAFNILSHEFSFTTLVVSSCSLDCKQWHINARDKKRNDVHFKCFRYFPFYVFAATLHLCSWAAFMSDAVQIEITHFTHEWSYKLFLFYYVNRFSPSLYFFFLFKNLQHDFPSLQLIHSVNSVYLLNLKSFLFVRRFYYL